MVTRLGSPGSAWSLTRSKYCTGRVTPSGSVDRKSTRLNSSHANISYAVFRLKTRRHRVAVLVRPGNRRQAPARRYREQSAHRHDRYRLRSHEHTSELQSLAYLVLRLLLDITL